MTLNQIVNDILDNIRTHYVTDDIDIDHRDVIYHLNIQRALWIKNKYGTLANQIDYTLIQLLGCEPLIVVDATTCCADLNLNCKLLRTEKELPKFMVINSKPAITRVGLPNFMNKKFKLMNYEQAIINEYNEFTGNATYGFMLGNYLYIVPSSLHTFIDKVSIHGVFIDPEALRDYNNCDGENCFSDDTEYPFPDGLLAYIRPQIISALTMSLGIQKDSGNDAKEEINGQKG